MLAAWIISTDDNSNAIVIAVFKPVMQRHEIESSKINIAKCYLFQILTEIIRWVLLFKRNYSIDQRNRSIKTYDGF